MASSTSSSVLCATCHKAKGTFMCRGCGQNFCMPHVGEHRQSLALEMDEYIVPLHDQLQEKLDKQFEKSTDHPLIKEINQWEHDSIEKIHQMANDTRQEMFNIIDKHLKTFKDDLKTITQELKQARRYDQFFENDLKEWMKKLNELEEHLIIRDEVHIEYNHHLPSKISIRMNTSIESFRQAIGNMNILENGLVIVHQQTNNYASVRGQRYYSQGEHQLRFQIEYLTNNWVFFGIVSKDALIPDYPSIGKTAYGWSGLDDVWRNGIQTSKLHGYQSDFKVNDQMKLIINCDQQSIQLINERTNTSHTLHVDTNDCPLPWKLTVGLYYSPGERIRLLL